MPSLPEQTTPESVIGDTTLSQPFPQASSRIRLFFLDHLRVALTILVVLHHLAVIYGAAAVFYYVEIPGRNDQLASLMFSVFVLVNQSYFMGCFFLIAGYFTPGSFDRKGPGAFYKDRLLRLGIPLLAFVLVLSPISFIGIWQMPASVTHITTPITWQEFLHSFGVGPLWFAEMLLFFCLGYMIWRQVIRSKIQSTRRVIGPPSYLAVGLFILVLAVASYLMRIIVPIGMEIPIFGFPTLAYLPQYLSFFVLGIIAFRQNWFQTIPSLMGKIGFVVALVATVLLAAPALSKGSAFLGNGTFQSAAYALWDSIFSVGICLALITFFRHFLNRQSRIGSFLSQQAFVVYIIHIPVIVLLGLALRGIHLEALLKFALAALIGLPLCLMLAFLVRKLPFASRIL